MQISGNTALAADVQQNTINVLRTCKEPQVGSLDAHSNTELYNSFIPVITPSCSNHSKTLVGLRCQAYFCGAVAAFSDPCPRCWGEGEVAWSFNFNSMLPSYFSRSVSGDTGRPRL